MGGGGLHSRHGGVDFAAVNAALSGLGGLGGDDRPRYGKQWKNPVPVLINTVLTSAT